MQIVKTLDGFDRNVKVSIKQIHADPLIKMKKYDGATTGVSAGLDKNGFPVTGLTEDTITRDGKGKETVVPGTRKILEKELDLEEGTLKSTNVNYWASFFVRIGAEPIEFDLNNSFDLLKYLFCRGQSIVADNQAMTKTNSRFEFVLYSEEQEAVARIEGRKSLKEAYRLADSLDLETKINILAVYGEIADATSPNTIIDKIDELVEQNPKKFLAIADDKNLVAKSLLQKALDKAVLTMNDGAVYHKDVVVGYTLDMAAEAIIKDKKLATVLKAELSGDMELIKKALADAKPEKTK